MYKEKDSDSQPRFWLVEGNSSRSAQLTGLGKYVLYEVQVLAFTRIGDGVPSHPPILERTLDDGEFTSPGTRGGLGAVQPPLPTPSPAPLVSLCLEGNRGPRLLLGEVGHRGPPNLLRGLLLTDRASLRKKGQCKDSLTPDSVSLGQVNRKESLHPF